MRTRTDFFNDMDALMTTHKKYVDDGYTILPNIGNNGNILSAENAFAIVDGLKKGERDQLENIGLLRIYVKRVLDSFLFRTGDTKHWDYHYDGTEDIDLYSIELSMIPVLRRLLYDLENETPSFFGFISPDEEMALKDIQKKTRLPEDIVFREIRSFVGHGRRKTRATRRTTKSKVRGKNKEKQEKQRKTTHKNARKYIKK